MPKMIKGRPTATVRQVCNGWVVISEATWSDVGYAEPNEFIAATWDQVVDHLRVVFGREPTTAVESAVGYRGDQR
jgi:hypothetical protein